ncbi:MAG: hypothetical protein K5857_07920 [Lachnospiraceae bacterium]|nr:hypothetical protein [Lachnospiraceae bacterium]
MEKKGKKKTWIIFVIIGVVVLLLLVMLMGSSDDGEYAQTETEEEYSMDDEEETEDEPEEGSEEAASVETDQTWTIMVYMCGTDLESEYECGTANLYEMFSANLGVNRDKINVLVETGGTEEWAINEYTDEFEEFNGIDPGSLNYYRIGEYDIIPEETRPLASMGEPDTLKDFITWGKETHPADKYMLIFWDHGGGSIGGVCVDELHDYDTLTLPEIKKAVTEADVPFEAVGFDACLMATLETAQALQGYGHYLIASEETEPGGGWDYTGFLEYLSKDTGISGLDLGKRIVDGYMDKCAEGEADDMATLSVTDLTRIPALSAAYRSFSGEMVLSTQETDTFRSVQQGIVRAESYGGNTESEGYTNMVDLGDLVKQTENVLNQNAANVLGTLKDAVQYEVHGSSRSNANGLSVYYPLKVDEEEIMQYKAFSDNTAFEEFVSILSGSYDSVEWEKEWEDAWKEAYSAGQTQEGKYDSYFNEGVSIASDYGQEPDEDYYESISSITPIQKEEYDLKFTQELMDDGYHQLKITSGLDMVSDVSFMLYYEEEESGMCVYLGSDNTLDCDYENGIFTEDFEGTWMTIGDEFVYAELIEQNEEYNLYTVPILLNGKEKYLKAVYDYGKEEFRILGAYDGIDSDTGQSGRDVKQLKDGDKIEFLFYIFDPESEDDDDVEMVTIGELTWKSDMKMEDSELGDGKFIYMFQINSFFGDEDYADPVYMEIKDGEIYSYEP